MARVSGETIKNVRRELTRRAGEPWLPNRRGVSQETLAELWDRERKYVVKCERKGGDHMIRLSLIGLLAMHGLEADEIAELFPELVGENDR